MIIGNPNAGRKIAGVALAVLLAMFLITAIVISQKRQSPAKEPPILHPSTVVTLLLF
jgi:hypothetical protein